MRFTPEELNNTLFLANDPLLVKGNDARLVIVSDTIKPSRTEKVEEVVPVKTSVQQNRQQEEKEKQVEEATGSKETETAKEEKDTEQEKVEEKPISTHTPTEPRRQTQETHQQPATPTQDREGASSVEAVVQPLVPVQRVLAPATDQVPESVSVSESGVYIPFIVSYDSIPYPVVSDSIAALDSLNLAKKQYQGMSSYTYDSQKEGKSLPLNLDRSDGVFVLLAICFLVLAHIFRGGFSYFKENIMLVFSASKSERLERQTTSKEIFNTVFLLFLAVLLISISLYEGLDKFIPLAAEEKRPFETIALFILLMLSFIFIKLMLNRLIGYIFDLGKNIVTWNQSYIVLLSMLGILCFLPTLMLVYSNLWSTAIIGFVLFLFLAVQLILFVRIILFFIGQKFNFLYLIAYLCTVEILPYVFLGIGLIYIYRIDIFNTIL